MITSANDGTCDAYVTLDQQHTRLLQEPLPAPAGLIPPAHTTLTWLCNRTSTPTAQERLSERRPPSLERHHSSCPGVPAGARGRLAQSLHTASLSIPHLLTLCLPPGQRPQLSSPRARHLLHGAQTSTCPTLRDRRPPSGSPSRRLSPPHPPPTPRHRPHQQRPRPAPAALCESALNRFRPLIGCAFLLPDTSASVSLAQTQIRGKWLP